MVLGKLPPSPNSNANPKPRPDPDRGTIFLGGNFPDTKQIKSNTFSNNENQWLYS